MKVFDESLVLFDPGIQRGFVETPYILELEERCLAYIRCGFPIHLQGRAGTGKTSLALRIARRLARPVVLIYGCDEFGISDLVGGYFGYRRRMLIDNFIHSVQKTEEDIVHKWIDERLTLACRYGYTLVYDEFTRSRPETNNVLLSILEERILDLPTRSGKRSHLRVNPEFSAIFTSNPEEYVGVHKSQDALKDRMLTICLDDFDRETEVAITKEKTGLSSEDAGKIVDLVRAFRSYLDADARPTVRACIMIGKITRSTNARVSSQDKIFLRTCIDVLSSAALRGRGDMDRGRVVPLIEELVHRMA